MYLAKRGNALTPCAYPRVLGIPTALSIVRSFYLMEEDAVRRSKDLGYGDATTFVDEVPDSELDGAGGRNSAPFDVDDAVSYASDQFTLMRGCPRDSVKPVFPVGNGTYHYVGQLKKIVGFRVRELHKAKWPRCDVVRVFYNVTAKTLKSVIAANVDKSAHVITDDWSGYRGLRNDGWNHDSVKHSMFEYVRGDVHTNSIEGFFGMLRRGLDGIYHSVSKKHLHRYLSEFEFRHNHRELDDGQRTVAAIKAANHKRLTYKQQVGDAD